MKFSKGDIVSKIQITSQLKQDELSISITNNDVTVALPVNSYIRVHKIFVLEQRLIKGKVSSLKIDKYKEVIHKIDQIIQY